MKKSKDNRSSFIQTNLINHKEHEHPEHRHQDSTTGAHFEYFNMCLRLKQLKKQIERERGTEVVGSAEEAALCEAELVRDPFYEFAQKIHGMLKAQCRGEKTDIPEGQATRLQERLLNWDAGLEAKAVPRLRSAAQPYPEEQASTSSQQGSQKKLYENYKALHRM